MYFTPRSAMVNAVADCKCITLKTNNMETNFERMFAERSPEYAFLLTRLQCAIEKDHVDYEDINTANLRKFKDYMEGEVTNNTLKMYFSRLSVYIRECANDGLIANDKCLSALKVKTTPQQNVALTEEEVNKIYDYYTRLCTREKHQAEKDVLVMFLVECYCGARGCDVEEFTLNNIKDGVLSYVSKKTKTLVTMPAHKNLISLIKKIPKKRKYDRGVKNRIVKRTCERVGIIEPITMMYHGKFTTRPKYEYVSFHTARRSCITNLLNRGVPLVQVSKLAGHSSTQMTNRYYCTDKINLDDNAMAFFNG